jgi:hypothetical protein
VEYPARRTDAKVDAHWFAFVVLIIDLDAVGGEGHIVKYKS